MKAMLTAISATLAAGTVFLALPTEARALGPIDLEVGAKVGYATNPSSDLPYNPFGFGLGARAGVALFGIYVGGNFMYYTGGSTDLLGVKLSSHALQYGAEVGYGIKIAILTLRPQIGFGNIGIASSFTSAPCSGTFCATVTGPQDQTENNFYVEPGLTALISLGLVYVGADVNALIIPGVSSVDDTTHQPTSKTYASFTFHGQVGLKF